MLKWFWAFGFKGWLPTHCVWYIFSPFCCAALRQSHLHVVAGTLIQCHSFYCSTNSQLILLIIIYALTYSKYEDVDCPDFLFHTSANPFFFPSDSVKLLLLVLHLLTKFFNFYWLLLHFKGWKKFHLIAQFWHTSLWTEDIHFILSFQ